MKINEKRRSFTLLSVVCLAMAINPMVNYAAEPADGNAAFIKGLRDQDAASLSADWKKSAGLDAKVKSVSRPRSFSPKVSRFKGWYIDSQGKHPGKSDDAAVDSVIMAKTPLASSYWQLVETDRGYVIIAAGGPQQGRVLSVDETAPTRPEGRTLTVSECLRLTNKIGPTSFWDITLTSNGVVVESLAGKYKGWCWDFGGNAESGQQAGREVAKNVLLAEREVAGSYYDVAPQP